MNQQVIITLRGTAELKGMLVTLSKLKHEPMNVIVADLIRKEYETKAGMGSGDLPTILAPQPEPPDYVPPSPIRDF